MKKRILMITDYMEIGGTKTYLSNISKAFTRSGHDFRLICFTDTFKTSTPKCQSILLKSKRILFLPFRLPKLRRKLIQQIDHTDLILLDLSIPAAAALLTLVTINKKTYPIIYQFHGLSSLETLSSAKFEPELLHWRFKLKHKFRQKFESVVLNSVDTIIVFSNYAKQLLTKTINPSTPIKKISPGKDIEFETLGIRKKISKNTARKKLGFDLNKKLILMATRIEPRKGLFNILNFLATQPKSFFKDKKFIIASSFADNYYANIFLDHLVEQDLSSHFYLVNCPPRHHLALLYRSADLTLMPSLELETFGFTTLESHSFGTPVAAYSVCANKELVTDSKLLINPKHPHKLITGLDKILNYIKKNQKQLELNCAANARQYSWQDYTNNLIELGLSMQKN